MKNFLLTISTCIIYLLMTTFCDAQNVGINATGALPHPSAGLDIDFSNKGTLITRMTTTQRDNIAVSCSCTPATGLQIFNTTSNCLEIYSGTAWLPVSCPCTGAPAAAGIISGTSPVCPGQTAVLYTVPAITGATSYTWSYAGTGTTIVGSSNAVILYFSATATSGNLTVIGSNACGNGTVSANYAVVVNSTSPGITTQPVSPTSVCSGTGTPSFTVIASGASAYQWQEFVTSWNNVSNGGVYSGAASATLTITNPTAGMNGYKYRCIVSGTCTSITSDGLAMLTVTPMPAAAGTISGSAAVCQGQNSVSYSVPSIANATSYTWAYSGTGATISGSTNSTTINFSGTATSGNLTVMGTNACANGTVSANYAIALSAAPNITAQPSSPATVCGGVGTATFTVAATGTGLTYQWQEFAGSSWNNVSNGGVYSGVTGATLTLTNPTASMNGYKYHCVVSGNCTPSATSDGSATLTVVGFQSGLVGFWTLEGNSNDHSGNNNNGTDLNTTYGTLYGHFNQGVSFSGNGYADLGNSTTLNVSSVTVSAWVKTTSADGSIWGKYSGSSGGHLAYQLRLSSGVLVTRIEYANGNFLDFNTGANTLNDGNWHMVTLTYAAGNGYLYIDGVQKGAATGGSTIFYEGNFEASIGAAHYGGGWEDFISASIDEVRVYNRAMSSTEVSSLYANEPCP